jgi:hypothetical protein
VVALVSTGMLGARNENIMVALFDIAGYVGVAVLMVSAIELVYWYLKC